MDYSTSFPAISTSDYWGDRVVTQGHADYCAAHGHARHVVNGVTQTRCPRCGADRRTVMVVSRSTGEHVICNADDLATATRALFPRSSAVLEHALGQLQRAYLSTNGAISLDGIQWFLGVSIVELEDSEAVAA